MEEVKNLTDVERIPKDQWIVVHSVGGKCPYCGKNLPVFGDCCLRYGACDCEVAVAIKEHNDKVIELRK